jgi:hypothetical protein
MPNVVNDNQLAGHQWQHPETRPLAGVTDRSKVGQSGDKLVYATYN